MAFVAVEHWQVASKTPFHFPVLRRENTEQARPSLLHQALTFRPRSKARAIILSIVVHVLLVAFLIGFAPNKFRAGKKVDETSLTVFNIRAQTPKIAELEAPAESRTKVSANVLKTELDSSTATQFKREWSVAKIRVPRPVGPANITKAVSVTPAGSNVYDPFAGAAPNRKISARSVTPPSGRLENTLDLSNADPRLDKEAFTAWIVALKKRLPRSKGAINLEIKVSQNGKTTSAKILGGTASPHVKLFVRNSAMTQWLFLSKVTGEATADYTLPEISLG